MSLDLSYRFSTKARWIATSSEPAGQKQYRFATSRAMRFAIATALETPPLAGHPPSMGKITLRRRSAAPRKKLPRQVGNGRDNFRFNPI
jgi:hypothetical protein